MPHRRPVFVVTGKHPFEVCVLACSVLAGLGMLITGFSPNSVQASMPGGIATGWELLLVGGGIVALVGIFWPGKLLAQLGCEAAGVLVFGAALLMYVIAIFVLSGVQALAAGTFLAGLAVACFLRVGQIARDIRRVTHAVEAGTTMNMPLLATEDRR